jgi:hypothetical protein
MSAVKFTAHLDEIFFFIPQVTIVNAPMYTSKNSTPPQFASAQLSFFRHWQFENKEMEPFVNTLAP